MSMEHHGHGGGFTAVPNVLDRILPTLSAPQFKVLFVIIRKTVGFHKSQDQISLSQLEQATGMARSTVVDAIRGLKTQGLIIVRRVAAVAGDSAPSVFRLGPVFTAGVVQPTGQVDRQTGQGVVRTAASQKTSGNISNHASSDASTVETTIEATHDGDDASCTQKTTRTRREQIPVVLPPSSYKPPVEHIEIAPGMVETQIVLGTKKTIKPEAAPEVVSPVAHLAEPILPSVSWSTAECSVDGFGLVDRLMAAPFGYSRRSADQIMTQFPVESVEAALLGVQLRKDVRNPAGYLLRELQAGGYAPPAVRPETETRRALLYALPTATAGAAVAAGDRVDGNEAEERLQGAIEALDVATKAAWMLEARANHARLAGKSVEKVREDSILVRAAFENLVRQRLLAA